MASGEYGAVFVGGGLAATLLLHGMRAAFPERVLVVDPEPPSEGPPVHWSYWSRDPTPYDRLSIGAWRRARVMDFPPEPISPFTLRLVRSTDVLASLEEALEGLPIERRRVAVRLGSCPAGSTRSPPTKAPSAPAGCSTAHTGSPRAFLLKAILAPC
jgi:hypothetical protein